MRIKDMEFVRELVKEKKEITEELTKVRAGPGTCKTPSAKLRWAIEVAYRAISKPAKWLYKYICMDLNIKFCGG